MHYKLLISFILILQLIFISSCNTVTIEDDGKSEIVNDSLSVEQDNQVFEIKYAEGFSIENYKGYQRLHIHNPWNKETDLAVYILAQKNQAKDIKLREGEKLIELPLQRVAIMSASNIGYFELLEKLDLIKALADGNRLYNPDLRLAVELGSVKVLGNSAAVNIEELLLSNCDAFIQTAYEASLGNDQALQDAGVLVVYNIDWMEKTPLARAEWIKFIGLLTGESKRANSVFDQIEKKYIELKQKVDTLSYKPDVLVGGLYKDVWYMPGGKSFKAHLLADAGTNYKWAADSIEGSLALSFETVMDQQMDAPVWIEVPFKTKSQLLASDERYAFFDAYKVGAMYHNLKRSNEDGGNDYWEKGLCRPDEILEDLIRIFHPEEMGYGELKYYGRLESN